MFEPQAGDDDDDTADVDERTEALEARDLAAHDVADSELAHGFLASLAALLLEHGADPESRSTNGAELAALHAAVAGGDLACVELLLARDVDVNALQQGGITALHAAAHHGRPDMVRALLRAGADPALTCEAGRDARSWGAEHPKVLALLV